MTTTTRKRSLPIMPVLSVGKTSYKYTSATNKFLIQQELDRFVDEIQYGPQIVSIPIPPQRHAFLIDIQKSKIMVSDWGGLENKYRGIKRIRGKTNPKYDENWKQYSELFIKLEKKHGIPVEYYPVDLIMYGKAYESCIQCDGGGCSKYIYEWKEKYYPNYS
jgi:hypothetical protein